MGFDPLIWVASSLTIYHFAAYILFCLSEVWFRRIRDKRGSVRWFGPIAVPILYALGSLMIGQQFGDQYPFLALWPSCVVLGFVVSINFLISEGLRKSLPPSGLGLLFIASGLFFSAGFSIALYGIPRLIGWGVGTVDRQPWAVTL